MNKLTKLPQESFEFDFSKKITKTVLSFKEKILITALVGFMGSSFMFFNTYEAQTPQGETVTINVEQNKNINNIYNK